MNPTCPSCDQPVQSDWTRCPQCGASLIVSDDAVERARGMLVRNVDRLSRLAEAFMDRVERFLQHLPFYERLAPYMGFRQLLRYRRWIISGSMLVPLILGLYPSLNGHIDTTPLIYQFMALTSYFSPILGIIGGLAFAAGDFAEKLVTNQIYGMTSNIGDYIGARVGYLIAYSSVILMGVLPGVLARVFQAFARRWAPRRLNARSGSGTGAVGMGINWLEVGAGVVGGMLGGGIAGGLAIPLNYPAFYLRPNPDVSCYSAAVSHLRRLITPASLSGGLGPAIDTGTRILRPGSDPPPVRDQDQSTSGTATKTGGPDQKAPSTGTATVPPGPTTDRIYDGNKAVEILKDLDVYKDLQSLDHKDPDYWEKFDGILEKSKGGRRVVGTAFDRGKKPTGPINWKDISIIVREPAQPQAPVTQPPTQEAEPTQPPEKVEPPTQPPQKTVPPPPPPVTEEKPPPDKPKGPTIDEFVDKWRRRLQEVRNRIRFLEGEKKKLEAEYAKRYAKWELCKKSAISDGLIDIADIAIFTKYQTTGFSQAAGKDVVKTGLKNAIKRYMRPPELAGEPDTQGAGWKDYLINPIGIGIPPSGGLKQMIQDAATKRGKVSKMLYRATGDKAFKTQSKRLKRLNPIYGFAESFKNFVQQTKSYMTKCEQYRVQMGGIRNRLSNINSALEDLRMDEAEAMAAVREGEKPIFGSN